MTTCILIVDDERDNRELLDIILAQEGFRVRTAASGEEALASVAVEVPDLILLDLMMPGMTGYDVMAKIKGHPSTRDIRIIIVTALCDDVTRMRALKAGAEDLVTKPFGHAELCSRVSTLLQ